MVCIFGSGYNITIRVLDPVHPVSFKGNTPEELALKLSSIMKNELENIRTTTLNDDT